MTSANGQRGQLLGGIVRWGLIALTVALNTSCAYLKMNPPPDTDKASTVNDNSCYLATASNMLAGAGYGGGTTVQARADDIYGDLTSQFGTANSGWTDTALSWWLASSNNTWTTNPYTVVTVYGNKKPRWPWANANGAKDIANELRSCNFVGLSISWPTNAVDTSGSQIIGAGGHAITGWGDSSWLPWQKYSAPVSGNPFEVRVTDSDRDTGGNVQVYSYDTYTNPNPGGANEGNGWYFDFDANHPYIKHIVTLSPTQKASGGANIQRVVGSYKLRQEKEISATDLHYQVGTDTEILSYNTRVDWATEAAPEIDESQPQRTSLDVDWNFEEKPIPTSEWVTITTEFILRNWNAMQYDNVHFTYPDGVVGPMSPPVKWDIRTPEIARAASIPNVTGGYLIGSFDVVDESRPAGTGVVGRYRLLHQYTFAQSPERHLVILSGREGFQVTNLRFGHSYGFLNKDALWSFEDWITNWPERRYRLGGEPVKLELNWEGRLPYPEGEDIERRIPDIKGGLRTKPREPGQPQLRR